MKLKYFNFGDYVACGKQTYFSPRRKHVTDLELTEKVNIPPNRQPAGSRHIFRLLFHPHSYFLGGWNKSRKMRLLPAGWRFGGMLTFSVTSRSVTCLLLGVTEYFNFVPRVLSLSLSKKYPVCDWSRVQFVKESVQSRFCTRHVIS